MLTPAQLNRYDRQIRVETFGTEAQDRLSRTRVLVIGAGGLASPILQYLAAGGIKALGIVDDDRVDVSNLPRQVVHHESMVGEYKVESAAHLLEALNRECSIQKFCRRLSDDPASLELVSSWDLVIDTTDNWDSRYAINQLCRRASVPLLWGSVYQWFGQYGWTIFGITACYECMFPVTPPHEAAPEKGKLGVMGASCGVLGSLMAGEAIRYLGSGEEPPNGFCNINILRREMDWFRLEPRKSCTCSISDDLQRRKE